MIDIPWQLGFERAMAEAYGKLAATLARGGHGRIATVIHFARQAAHWALLYLARTP